MRRKSRLFYLALSVFLPPMAVFLFAATDLVYSQRNMEELVRSYVEHFTESAAKNMGSGGGARGNPFRPAPPGRFPVLSAVLDAGGMSILHSLDERGRLAGLLESTSGLIPVGSAGEVLGPGRERFTAAMFHSDDGEYLVVGAISWNDMQSAAATVYIWPFFMVAAALWSSMSIWYMWRRIIRPIGRLEREISSIRWGFDPMGGEPIEAVEEIENMRATLVNVSRSVMDTQSANRTFMNDMVNVQEDERTKISRDIHDGPLQDVTALIQRLHLARLPGNAEEDTLRELDLAEKIALTSVKEMRALCDFLNPPWLELGLAQSLTELTERQSMQYGVRIFLGVDDDLVLPDPVTLAFFRVVQEAITNSVRHGEAKNIWVDIKKSENGVELTIQDDGHGFDMHESGTHGLRAEGHRGLSNMEERMTLVGGRLKIISFRGEGTCIRGFLP
ncbi:MAG: sensor histidine kinase [Synergistaceae bacterium]|nr:sensor histidine kinase [Synergistaceae bacterium]